MVASVQNVIVSMVLPQSSGAESVPLLPGTPATDGRVGDTVTVSKDASIQSGQELSFQAAKLINQTDNVYAKQQELLKKMGEQLQGIVKQYPPYGSTDPQRLEYLKSFDGLRREIEALQFPKDPHAEQGLPQGVALPTQKTAQDIPDLSSSGVTDAQVGTAATYVQSALAQVTQQREHLAQSVQTALGGPEYFGLVQSFAG